ncbi:PRKAG2 [Cordylochernes scorpioides]|uniref:PRKAG2 n=1 Tax=Cordylochernes scorpioides TaxID=51811 RepID=A0ABY6KIQ8_9ARAC|nr:PRKAG2 [Cordylochernes scorpioides]
MHLKANPSCTPLIPEYVAVAGTDENLYIAKFFEFNKCYDLIPISGKLVVFDTKLLLCCSLYEAITTLLYNRVHRLPVINPETGNVLHIITHKRILKYLFLKIVDLPSVPSFLQQPLEQHKVGTYSDIATVRTDETIIAALNRFVEKRVSALPVLDASNKVVDIYCRFDVIVSAAFFFDFIKSRNLTDTNDNNNVCMLQYFEGVLTCTMTESLLSIMEKIVKAEVGLP